MKCETPSAPSFGSSAPKQNCLTLGFDRNADAEEAQAENVGDLCGSGRGPPPAAEEGRPNPWSGDWGGTTLGARIRGAP